MLRALIASLMKLRQAPPPVLELIVGVAALTTGVLAIQRYQGRIGEAIMDGMAELESIERTINKRNTLLLELDHAVYKARGHAYPTDQDTNPLGRGDDQAESDPE
jgi:hypothetical protein